MNWTRAWLRVLLLTGILFLPFLGLWETSTSAAPSSGTSFALTLQHDHLSAAIENLPLRDVLGKLSRLTGLEVFLEGSVGDELVSIEFKNLPLEDGIRRILQGKSYAMTYAQTSFSKGHTVLPKVVGIRVVPKSAGPPMAEESTDSVIPLPGPGTREGLPEPFEAQMREALEAPESGAVTNLRDQDPKVREAALKRLGQSSQPLQVEPLAEMALTDTSTQLRMEALELLSEDGGDASLDPIKQALLDPDPGIRRLAYGLLVEQRVSAEILPEEIKEESR